MICNSTKAYLNQLKWDNKKMIRKKIEKAQPFIEDARETLTGMSKFKSRSTLMKAYTVTLALCILAILPMPYEFYISLRMLICIGLVVFLHTLNKSKLVNRGHYKYALVGLVILYNPLFVIHLGSKLVWALVNIGTLYFLFVLRNKLDIKDLDENVE